MFKKINIIILILIIFVVGIVPFLHAVEGNLLDDIKKILPDNWEILSHEEGIVSPMHRPKGPGQAIYLNPKNNKYFGKTGGMIIWIMNKEYGFPKADTYIEPGPQAGPSQVLGSWLGHPIFIWGRGGKSWVSWKEDIIKAFGEEFKPIKSE